jgi:NAD(P)-dependent dehydrogenase (short-subunit alcohol dehydrogenase family)
MVTDKLALVTGAGQGIGRAIALELARQGAAGVVVADRDEATARETAALVREDGANAHALACDLRDRGQIEAMVAGAVEQLGGLDVLVNNAGIIETALVGAERCTVDALPEAAWDAVYEVNLKAVWLATRFAAPHLRRSPRNPSIVNAASVSGLTGIRGGPAYGVTKAAVIQLTKLTAIDLAPVRCNCFCPGIIATPMARDFIASAPDPAARQAAMTSEHLIERLGTPEEIASLACYLASDAAGFITGAAFVADGGVLAWRGHR